MQEKLEKETSLDTPYFKAVKIYKLSSSFTALHLLLAFLSSSYCSKHWSFLQKIISLESQKNEQRRNKNRPNCLHHLVHLLLAVLIRHIAGNIGHFCKK